MTKLDTARQKSLRELADKQAIANVLAIHSRGIDRCDYALMRSAYHDDGQAVYGDFRANADDFCKIITESTRGQPVSLHRTSNIWIAVDGNRARSESYVIAYLETLEESGAQQRIVGGRYLDLHEKRHGEWRMTKRNYVLEWNINQPSTSLAFPPADKNFLPCGGQGAQDPGRALLAIWRARFENGSNTGDHKVDLQDAEIDAVLSKQALHELLMTSCRAVDRGDEDLLRTVYHADAAVVTGVFNGNAMEFCPFIINAIRTGMKSTFHSIANEWFDISGDNAVGESYVIAFSTRTDGGKDQESIVGGRYLDRYERRNGTWKIAERSFVMDWNINQPSTAIKGEGMYAALTLTGGYKPNDPIYSFWNHQ